MVDDQGNVMTKEMLPAICIKALSTGGKKRGRDVKAASEGGNKTPGRGKASKPRDNSDAKADEEEASNHDDVEQKDAAKSAKKNKKGGSNDENRALIVNRAKSKKG